jgi:hypothetical protein
LVDFTAVVPELKARGLLPDEYDGVFCSGSIARGWGSSTSDLDVTVVAPRQWTSSQAETQHIALTPDVLQYETIFVDGMRWDVEYWTSGQFAQVMDKVSTEQFADEHGTWRSLSYHEIAMLARFPYAVPTEDDGWLRAAQLDLAASAHRSVLIARSLREADGYTEDTAGQVENGDLDSAVISARLALQNAIDGLTAYHGQFGSLWPKWRARRMQLIESDVLSYERFWELETMAGYRREDAVAWIEAAIGVCRAVSMAVEL